MNKKIFVASIVAILALACVLIALKFFSKPPDVVSLEKPADQSTEDTQKKKLAWEILIRRGREVEKNAPPIKSNEWFEWYKKLSPEDRMARAAFIDQKNAPPPATKEQLDNIKVETTPDPSSSLKIYMLRNFKPLLRMDDGVSVRPLQISTVRTADGVVSTVWARRAQDSFVVNWDTGNVNRATVDTSKDVGGLIPQHLNVGMKLSGSSKEPGLSDTVGFQDDDRNLRFSVPWNYPKAHLYPLALDSSCDFAFGLIKDGTKDVANAILALNVKEKKIQSIITIPDSPQGVHVQFLPDQQHLTIVDSGWQWIMLIDISKATGKPAN